MTTDHQCFGGYVYVDPVRELEQRGVDPASYPDARFMKPCPTCAIRNFIHAIGGREMTWRNWEERVELEPALEAFQLWQPHDHDWICLVHGSPDRESKGTGRTHALAATGITYLEAGRRARYWNAGDMTERRFEPLCEDLAEFRGLALLDDLGNEAENLGTRDALDRIIDTRYRNRRPSIVVSTLAFQVIEKRYPRLARRTQSESRIEWAAPPFMGDYP